MGKSVPSPSTIGRAQTSARDAPEEASRAGKRNDAGSGRLSDAGKGGQRNGAAPAETDLVAREIQHLAAALGARGSTEKPRSEERDETTGKDEGGEDDGDSTIHGCQ